MKEKKERNNDIRYLRKKGYTYQELGNHFRMSRQRAQQIAPTKQGGFWEKLKEVWLWLRVIK